MQGGVARGVQGSSLVAGRIHEDSGLSENSDFSPQIFPIFGFSFSLKNSRFITMHLPCINVHRICNALERPGFPCKGILFDSGRMLPGIKETPAGVNLQGLGWKEESSIILRTLIALLLSFFGNHGDLSRSIFDLASSYLHTIGIPRT